MEGEFTQGLNLQRHELMGCHENRSALAENSSQHLLDLPGHLFSYIKQANSAPPGSLPSKHEQCICFWLYVRLPLTEELKLFILTLM